MQCLLFIYYGRKGGKGERKQVWAGASGSPEASPDVENRPVKSIKINGNTCRTNVCLPFIISNCASFINFDLYNIR